MDITDDTAGRLPEIVALFTESFSSAEGPEEGAAVGHLARRMITQTPAPDLRVFLAQESGAIIAAICFSRLGHGGDGRSVFLLSPVAVATARQGQGIGRRLIVHGLAALREEGVDIAVTYGDPDFYGRVGFRPVSEEILPAPFPLGQPEGWLACPLTQAPLARLAGPVRCVAALADPSFW